MTTLQELIKKKRKYAIWELNLPLVDVSKLKVLIINAPCMGFGDIVFAMKFSNILQSWYKCDIYIATPQRKGFISLGSNPDNIYDLVPKEKTSEQCRRLARLKVKKDGSEIGLPKVDLIFIAPLQADYDPNLKDVQVLIPYANKFNTYFLSEYNDALYKKIDFHTGVGGKRFGLLLTDTKIGTRPNINNPYCLVYVAQTIDRVKRCVNSFISMVGKKYSNKDFEIVIPSWIEEEEMIKPIVNILKVDYNQIIICRKDQPVKIKSGDNPLGNRVYLRLDILPVTNQAMLDLISYSVKDILLTGDQSITDALSCCIVKNIFYQIAPWKENFAKNLVEELPNKWLQKKSQSCGSLKAINYQSNYTGFREKWDFRILAKSKMDGIFGFISQMKSGLDSNALKEYVKLALQSKSDKSLLKKWREYIEKIKR